MRKSAYARCEQQKADQLAHLRSLISVFDIHNLDSAIPIDSISQISRF